MKRLSHVLCGVAVMLMAASAAPVANAQALMVYKDGASAAQIKKDRVACHEWAVQQTNFDPTATYKAQEAGVRTKTIMEVSTALNEQAGGTDPRWTAGGFGNTRTSADVRRLNALYADYLRAGALCLEGRGYAVTQ
ncbi:MAG: hypothetical protein WBV18_15370 [Methyloceanibacter sp.]|jgi:hypothetical protein|uniref:hypothetical protein n=1 Tax=Methyloceanibacter sp. TaxID=1965321 RepID=UPI003C4675EE